MIYTDYQLIKNISERPVQEKEQFHLKRNVQKVQTMVTFKKACTLTHF